LLNTITIERKKECWKNTITESGDTLQIKAVKDNLSKIKANFKPADAFLNSDKD